MKELRMVIKDLREDNDIKQKTVAEYLGVSQQTYSNYENGHREIPIWVVLKLSRYYKVSTDYLLGADSGYLGNTNLSGKYLGDTTLHDVVYELQQLDTADRRDLLKYIQFLKHDD
ncbi:MAG: helix-turn-helix domain-containing protein [Lachnospiraceae bacterium]|nr:helix-turn-helix transcriptional regulator [Lachnospiraceae bacterium]